MSEAFMSVSNVWRAVHKYHPDRIPSGSGEWIADENTGELLTLRVNTTGGPVELDLYQLAEVWQEWVQRYEPHLFERVVLKDGTVVRNRETGAAYHTTSVSCSCGSFQSQELNRELLSRYLPEFTPVCKHMRFLRELMSYNRVTVLYRVEGDRLLTWVAPSHEPITSTETGKPIEPGQVGLYFIGKASQLPTIQSRCLTRGWEMAPWEPYGSPVVR